jgi:hypothetical protein
MTMPIMPTNNQGTMITGGTVTGPVASGDRAQAIQYGSAGTPAEHDELRRELAALRELLDRYAAEVDGADKARRDADDIEQEICQAEPDRDRVTDALNRLAKRVSAVGALAVAVNKIREIVFGALA